jgi:hypothetical protein
MTISRRITAGLSIIPAVFLAYGCMTGGAGPAEDSPLYLGEAACQDTSIDSPSDRPCHQDCVRNCGFNGDPNFPRAPKYCVCQSGVFIECRCPRPDWYKGAIYAPYCDSFSWDGSGLTSRVEEDEQGNDDIPCDTEWQQCVGRDSVDGFTARGCVCLNKRGSALIWVCGSTEKWFAPEQSVRP